MVGSTCPAAGCSSPAEVVASRTPVVVVVNRIPVAGDSTPDHRGVLAGRSNLALRLAKVRSSRLGPAGRREVDWSI